MTIDVQSTGHRTEDKKDCLTEDRSEAQLLRRYNTRTTPTRIGDESR